MTVSLLPKRLSAVPLFTRGPHSRWIHTLVLADFFFFFTPDAFTDKTMAGICALSNQGAFVCWALVSLLSLRDVKFKKIIFFLKTYPSAAKHHGKKPSSTVSPHLTHLTAITFFPECHHGDSEI